MTRVKISAVILLLLVGTSAFSGVWVNRRCSRLLREIKLISQSADAEEKAVLAEEMNEDWESFREWASVLLKYDKLVEIDRLCSRIVHLTGEEGTEMEAELAELRDMLEMLKSGETPLWNSVF
ncbi:MAG: DUF4363 family protein [Ruminococcus sp.]|nr:DUF4363 family protein [Ruminococcus sp.]